MAIKPNEPVEERFREGYREGKDGKSSSTGAHHTYTATSHSASSSNTSTPHVATPPGGSGPSHDHSYKGNTTSATYSVPGTEHYERHYVSRNHGYHNGHGTEHYKDGNGFGHSLYEALTPVPADTTKSIGFRGYTEVGRFARDILYGTAAEGRFSLDNRVTISSRTASGVSFNAVAVNAPANTNITLVGAYSGKGWGGNAVLTGRIAEIEAYNSSLSPGILLSTSATLLPNNTATQKVGLEWSSKAAHLKTSVSVAAKPTASASFAVAHQQVAVGGEAFYDHSDPAKSATNWSLGGGWHTPDGQVAVFLTRGGAAVKAVVAGKVDERLSVAGEAIKSLMDKNSAPAFSLGAAYRVPGFAGPTSGLAKLKFDSDGSITGLFQDYSLVREGANTARGPKIGVSAQVDAFNLNRAPKVGVSIDI